MTRFIGISDARHVGPLPITSGLMVAAFFLATTSARGGTIIFTDNFESGVNFVAPDDRYAAGTIISTTTNISPTHALQLDDSPKSGALWTLPQTYQVGTYDLSFWRIRTAARGSSLALFAYDWPSTWTPESDTRIVNGVPDGISWTGLVPDSWEQVTFSQTLSAGNPALGKSIQFVLDQSNGTTGSYESVILVDNVSLIFTPASAVPEIDPAGMGSVLAFVSGVFGLLERRRTRA